MVASPMHHMHITYPKRFDFGGICTGFCREALNLTTHDIA
jgi:hypothetical protein